MVAGARAVSVFLTLLALAPACTVVGAEGVGGAGDLPDAGPATGDDAGAGDDGGADPYAVAPRCTSGTTWTGGNRESPLMQPGEACIACHLKPSGGPRFAFGGTVYPSAHEPSQCNGADGSRSARGAQVVVTDAAGTSFTAGVNAAGNFYFEARALVMPIKAKMLFQGRERLMLGAVPSGDCNACHNQAGTTTIADTLKAPGRILLP
jgi:hypothetical protein